MHKFVAAALAAIVGGSAFAGGFAGLPEVKAKEAAHAAAGDFGPYYLQFVGHCDVFEVWYNPVQQAIYGSQVGCNGASQSVVGGLDSNGYEMLMTVSGASKATLIGLNLNKMIIGYAISDGGPLKAAFGAATLSMEPVAPDAGTSIIPQ